MNCDPDFCLRAPLNTKNVTQVARHGSLNAGLRLANQISAVLTGNVGLLKNVQFY